MSRFSVAPELKVGTVVEVAGEAIRIEIDSTVAELTRAHNGDIYPIGQCGSVLKLHAGRRVLFAYVRVLKMRSEIAFEEGVPFPPPSEDSRMIEATLFAEGRWIANEQRLSLDRGVGTYPLPGQVAYLTTLEELSSLYGPPATKADRYSISIGNYVGANNSDCFADLDKLVGLHSAILGSTGSGKSGTVAVVLRSLLNAKSSSDVEASRLRPRIVLIDPHGEYSNAFKNRCVVYRAYSATGDSEVDDGSKQLRLPYWLMSGEEFRDLVIGKSEWDATSENNIALKALRHSRLVKLGLIEPARKDWEGKASSEGQHPSEDRILDDKLRARVAAYNRDTPDQFSLDEVRNHIKNEQGLVLDAKKTWKAMSTSDFKSHASILDKLAVLQHDPRLAFMMGEAEDDTLDLADVLQQFFGETENGSSEKDIRIIDISGLPNEVAGPLTAAIGRLIFQYKVWQTRQERERDPVLLVFEEAHRYVPDTGLAEYASAQKAIRRIAKEGAQVRYWDDARIAASV